MSRSQRHKIEVQGVASNGNIYDQGAINDQVLKALGGSIAAGIEANRPVLASISPTTAALAAAQLTLTCTGTVFKADSVIVFKGVRLPTTYVSATSLTAPLLPATYGVGTWQVQVVTGDSLASAATKPFIIT